MKNRILSIGLVLALTLTTLIPATALAKSWNSAWKSQAGHFTTVLTPEAIDDTVLGTTWPVRDTAETNVWPIVDLVEIEGVPTPAITGWIIDGRSIYGDVEGDFAGMFTFTYGGVVDILQSGSIEGVVTIQTAEGTIYLAGNGDLEAAVLDYYQFAEIQAWCTAVGLSVGQFFAIIYNNSELAGLPDVILEAMYGDVLPPLPKTLTAEFSGSLTVEAATGINSGISGQGKIQPVGGQPLVLHVYPNQHVYDVDGAIKLTGTYYRKPVRELKVDREKLRTLMEQWKD